MSVLAASAAMGGTASPRAKLINGGTQGSPTNLSSAVSDTAFTKFVLGDGWYNGTTITRAGITIRAQNKHQAFMSGGVDLDADDITIDGLERIGESTPFNVNNPGCKVLNCHAGGFAKVDYANGIWVFKTALANAAKPVLISGNLLDDCGGGDQFWGAIAVGLAADVQDINDVRITIIGNTIIGNQTTPGGTFNASLIQWLHPANVYYNFCSGVVGTSLQNKSINSHILGNECTLIWQDGALYNRLFGNNLYEYNLVYGCDYGVDHFRGNGVTYRGNVIYDCDVVGRIKVLEDDSHDITFEDNTFYNCAGGWEWDAGGGGTFDNILWQRCIWHTVTGAAIVNQQTAAWDETDNLFYLTTAPTGTTGAGGTSDAGINPQFANPPTDFAASAAEAAGRGAPWPMPWM